MASPEGLHILFKDGADFSAQRNSREISMAEVENLKDQMIKVKLLTRVAGEKIEYKGEGEYAKAYNKELEVPVMPGGILKAGTDALNLPKRTIFVYMHFLSPRGTIRYIQYLQRPNEKIPSFRFSISDEFDNAIYTAKADSLDLMNKSEYDIVLQMSDHFINGAKGFSLPPNDTLPEEKNI